MLHSFLQFVAPAVQSAPAVYITAILIMIGSAWWFVNTLRTRPTGIISFAAIWHLAMVMIGFTLVPKIMSISPILAIAMLIMAFTSAVGIMFRQHFGKFARVMAQNFKPSR